MSSPPERNAVFDPNNPGKKRHASWPDQFSGERFEHNQVLKNVILKLHLRSISSNSGSTTPRSESEADSESVNSSPLSAAPDYSGALSDELLLKIFDRISDRKQHFSNSAVCKRWCAVSGKSIQSIKLLDWDFLVSGRLGFRFPNLVDINIVPASIYSERNSGILLCSKSLDVCLNSDVLGNDGFFVRRDDILDCEGIDRGLKVLAKGCRNLRRIAMMNVGEEGLGYLANECELLQEIELHYCSDLSIVGVSKLRNLQILKLIGRIGGVYDSVISDIGLTLLAQGCGRLVKLELVGCEGSYDGIKAIGMCCHMLEELILCNHRMEGGWLSALSYCGNLKTLIIQSCKYIDENPGPDEHLGLCPMLEELHLRRCHMRDKTGVKALFVVCRTIRVLEIEDCWRLDNDIFAFATIFRSIRSLLLEGCSLLTTEGLEGVILSWTEIDSLKVISCSNVKDCEISQDLATLFSDLKELKWRPDSRSLLSASLIGTGIGEKGGRSLKSYRYCRDNTKLVVGQE